MAALFRLSIELPMAWSGSNELMTRDGSTRTVATGCAKAGRNIVTMSAAADKYVLGLILAPVRISVHHGGARPQAVATTRCVQHTEQIMKKVALLALVSGIAVWAQNRAPAPAPSPVSKLLRTLLEAANADQAVRDVRTIWETDRWFTFPKFEETAKNVAAIMKRAGLEDVEIGNAPADGVTQAGFWTEPMAWDVHVGTLEIVEPQVPAEQRILADYQKVPSTVCMWSGPTPAGGVVAEVVAPSGNIDGMDLKGKLLLGQRGSKAALWK